MPLKLYDAFVPSCQQLIGAVQGLLDKAEAHCRDTGLSEAEGAGWKLHDTMLPLAFQVKSVADHSWGAIEGVQEGLYDPMRGTMPTDFASMRAKLEAATAGLASLEPDDMEAMIGKPVLLQIPRLELRFKAEDYLLSFAQPNFYFHASIVYAILRAKGIALGKKDFLGRFRLAI